MGEREDNVVPLRKRETKRAKKRLKVNGSSQLKTGQKAVIKKKKKVKQK